MLPLKSLMDALKNVLRNPDCLIRAFALPDRRLKDYNSGFVLEEPADGFNIKAPERCDFRATVVALGCSGRF